MRRLLAIVCLLGVASVCFGSLTWESANLDPAVSDLSTASDGWLVIMYHDVDNNTDLSLVTFNLDGTPTGAGNSANDVALVTTTLSAQDPGFGLSVDFSLAGIDYSSFDLSYLYTVILDTTSWGSATTANRTIALDDSTYFLDGAGNPNNPRNYNVSSNLGPNDWQNVIPEPGTMGLLATGLVGLLAIRRKKMI